MSKKPFSSGWGFINIFLKSSWIAALSSITSIRFAGMLLLNVMLFLLNETVVQV